MQANQPDFMVFTGNANPALAAEIAQHLHISLGAAHVGRFSDGEVTVEINQNVRARDVFVVQSTCAPTNDNLMELLIMVDALKRASAERISAVIPYGYARQDRRPRSTRVPISAKVVANMLQAVGVARVLTMDLHADQIQGFFDIPVDNIYASPCCWAICARRTTRPDRRLARRGRRGARARWPSNWGATWPSSTSAAPRPTCPK
jgi:ribose-phosphate pyrophosphokinase